MNRIGELGSQGGRIESVAMRMKGFRRTAGIWTGALAVIIIAVNVLLFFCVAEDENRAYRVQINRVEQIIKEQGAASVDIGEFANISGIRVLSRGAGEEEKIRFFAGGEDEAAIRYIDGVYYRIDWRNGPIAASGHQNHFKAELTIWVNVVMAVMSLLLFAFLLFIKNKILSPFHEVTKMPYELAKGNLPGEIKENKNRYFARFIWGLNLLRERLEAQTEKELALQREQKTMILSVSHDIKTPLSAIKLYAKALSRNLYDETGAVDRQKEIGDKICQNVEVIENFVAHIVAASGQDFLDLTVENKEFYLDELLQEIDSYYREKLSYLQTDFEVRRGSNCLLKGDWESSIRVLQNVMENAIKYGDGKQIKISVSEEEDCKLITVSNSGCDLPKEEMPHIFESFWRGSNVGNRSGSGLGLYICRQLMMKMDGDIFARVAGDRMEVTVVFRMV